MTPAFSGHLRASLCWPSSCSLSLKIIERRAIVSDIGIADVSFVLVRGREPPLDVPGGNPAAHRLRTLTLRQGGQRAESGNRDTSACLEGKRGAPRSEKRSCASMFFFLFLFLDEKMSL